MFEKNEGIMSGYVFKDFKQAIAKIEDNSIYSKGYKDKLLEEIKNLEETKGNPGLHYYIVLEKFYNRPAYFKLYLIDKASLKKYIHNGYTSYIGGNN